MARWWCAWERRQWVCYLAWSFRIDFLFFRQTSEIISLVCLIFFFFLRFYLDVTCWILSLEKKQVGKTCFLPKALVLLLAAIGGVFRSGTKQERDLSPITFVTKALHYQQWDQLRQPPLSRWTEYASILVQFWDLYNLARESMMQFPSGSQEIFPIPPCGRHEPWTQEEGILTTSPLNPLPPSSGAVSGGFVITSRLWKSRPSLQLQG